MLAQRARDGVVGEGLQHADQPLHHHPHAPRGQSKLACLMFAMQLQRWSDDVGAGLVSVAAHPGISRTDLLHNAPGRTSLAGLARTWLWFLFQPAVQGALPTLYAATSTVTPGGYYGPVGFQELRGAPGIAKIPPQALDLGVAKRLWDVSQQLTSTSFPTTIATTTSTTNKRGA